MQFPLGKLSSHSDSEASGERENKPEGLFRCEVWPRGQKLVPEAPPPGYAWLERKAAAPSG